MLPLTILTTNPEKRRQAEAVFAPDLFDLDFLALEHGMDGRITRQLLLGTHAPWIRRCTTDRMPYISRHTPSSYAKK